MKLPLLVCSILLASLNIKAQNQNLDSNLYKLFRYGVDCSIRNQHDSAITIFKQFIAMLDKRNMQGNERYCYALNNIGDSYKQLAKPQLAHEYMYKALLLSRQYKHLVIENVALLSLNTLHWDITKKNWNFIYPAAQTTYGSYVLFPVEKTLPYKEDSIIVVVYAGRNDGINDSSYGAKIYKRYDSSLRNHPDVKDLNAIARGTIQKIESNRTYLIVKRTSDLNIEENDQANLYCQTPVALKKSHFADFFSHGINLSDNLKNDRLVNRRFLYYYNDDMMNFEFIKILKQEIFEVQKYYAEDTLNPKHQLAQKATAGIFKGLNIIKAIDSTNTKHIIRFLHFVSAYPGKYFGNTFAFTEVYATWLLNNTPLKPEDVLDYLFTVDDDKRPALTNALMPQIKNYNLVEQWVNDGFKYLDENNMPYARGVAVALQNVFKNNKDSAVAGWMLFFNGMYQYKAGDIAFADTLLNKSLRMFTRIGHKEGQGICKQAINKIHSNNTVSLQVQAGNFASYKVAMHPNGKYYATCGQDRNIRIWDLQLGKETKLLQEHNAEVTSIAYSPNGRYMASAARDKTIIIWSTFDYSPISTIKTNSIEYCLAFSPANEQLAAGGADSLIKMWDFNKGQLLYTLKKHKGSVVQLCFVAKNENILYSAGRDSMVYEWNLATKEDVHWYRKKSILLNMKASSDGNYLFYTANDTTVNVWNVLKGKFYFSQKISFAQYGTSNNFGEPDFSPDGNLLAFPDSKNRLAVVDLSSGLMNSIAKGASGYQYMNTINFTPDQQQVFVSYPFTGRTRLYDFSSFKSTSTMINDVANFKNFKVYTNPPLGLQYGNDGKNLFVITERLSKFNLGNGSTQQLLYSPQQFYNESFMLNDSIAMQTKEATTLVLYNHQSKNYVSTITLANNDTLAACQLDAAQSMGFIAGKHGLIEKHRIINGQFDSSVSFSLQLPLLHKEDIHTIKLDTFRNRFIVSSTNNRLFCISINNGSLTSTHTMPPYGDFAITPNYVYFNNHDGNIVQTKAINFETVKKTVVGTEQDVASFIKPSHDYKSLIAFVNETDLAVLDAASNEVKYKKESVHDTYMFSLAISPDSKYFVTGGFDTKICLFNLATGEKKLNIFTPAGMDFVAADTLGNYLASKKSLEGLSFKYNDKIYGFDQFDLRFNRPDIVLQKTGNGDTALIEAYKQAVGKRLRKAGYANENLLSNTQLPTLFLKDQTNAHLFTNLANVEVMVGCADNEYPLKSVHVVVNNNPVHGLAGLNLGSSTKDTTFDVKIPLAFGKNDIKLYCTNTLGQTSLQQTLEVNSSYGKREKAKTWFVGIGVSNYKNKNMNLRYAAKDIRDLVGTFTKGMADSLVSIDTLLNENATLQNIQAIKQKLMGAGVNDKVIVAVTGHGLLNKALDFYYATYDVDFESPEKKGLKYEQLEALLDGVPAQQKLLLIDACHSGALDKEAMLADTAKTFVQTAAKDTGAVSGKGARSTVKIKRSKVSLNNTFELMQSMFADFGSSNGAVVISAAGGLEYAFESPQWNNGVFTYCIRKGLEEMGADEDPDAGNYDLDVSVQELMKYVAKKVPELTNGRQRPTSRRESLEFDWVVKAYTK